MEKEVFNKIMERYCTFYEKKLTDLQMEIWFDMFKFMSPGEFDANWKDHIRNSSYSGFPAVGAIKGISKDLNQTPHVIL